MSSYGELCIVVLDIGETFIPHVWMLRVVHAQNVYDHHVDNLYLAISLGMESRGLSKFCIQHRPNSSPKFTQEYYVLI